MLRILGRTGVVWGHGGSCETRVSESKLVESALKVLIVQKVDLLDEFTRVLFAKHFQNVFDVVLVSGIEFLAGIAFLVVVVVLLASVGSRRDLGTWRRDLLDLHKISPGQTLEDADQEVLVFS